LWITRLRAEIEDAGVELPNGLRLLLFGSARTSPDPSDLDLLLVYDSAHVTPLEAISAKNTLIASMSSRLNRPMHFCLLSEAEAKQTRFISQEGAEAVFDWHDVADQSSVGTIDPELQ
jgi:hypothetical protein